MDKLLLGALLALFSICVLTPLPILRESLGMALGLSLLLAAPLSKCVLEERRADCKDDVRSSSNMCDEYAILLVSTWCSSVIYILDWNTSWQRFPIPTLMGFCIGCFCAWLSSCVRSNNCNLEL